ncbi:MAG: VOC family protein [Rhizobiaceae bacterium]
MNRTATDDIAAGLKTLEAEGFIPPLKIDHFGIAVRDLGAATRLFTEFLGARIVAGGINHAARLRTTFVQFPDGGKIELLQPTGENPIHHFLEKRGEGIHHVTILVRDVKETADRLKAAGFRVVDEDFSAPGWKEAYISPKSAFGCVLQIVQVDAHYGKPVDGITIEDVLADRWEWVDQKPTRR